MNWNKGTPETEHNSPRGAYSRVVVVRTSTSEGEQPAWYFSHPDKEYDDPHWEDPAGGDRIIGVLDWREMTELEREWYDQLFPLLPTEYARTDAPTGLFYVEDVEE